jgi:hypothetical protein
MITATEAYKETNEFINDPNLLEKEEYKYFIYKLHSSECIKIIENNIFEEIKKGSFELLINVGRSSFQSFINEFYKRDKLKNFNKYFKELGYKVEIYSLSSDFGSNIIIKWSEANK